MQTELEYLAIVPGMRGPQFQLWSDDVRTGNGELQPHLFLKKLDVDEQRLDIKTLAKLYSHALV